VSVLLDGKKWTAERRGSAHSSASSPRLSVETLGLIDT
jgi:hypothetical protein